MTTFEKNIVSSYIGQPDQEDCSSDIVPDSALSSDGRKTLLMPKVTSMTKFLFASNRLKMYSYLNSCLRKGTLRTVVGFPFFNRVLNKESCVFPHVSFWRIDRSSFWADVEVALRLETSNGQRDWRGVLSLWCSFGNSFSCSIEDFTDCVDRKAEGYDALSPFLIPYFTNKRVDEVSEDLWITYCPKAIAHPQFRDPVKLANAMGLSVLHLPLFNHKGIGGVLFFADGEIQVREESADCEEETPKTVLIPANTTIINTNTIHSEYSSFDVFHECFHYEFHYLFYRLQDIYNTDLRKIKSIEVKVDQDTDFANPVYFMEKQANRGAYGLLMPASSTEKMIKHEVDKVVRFRHIGDKYELAGKAMAKELSLPHFRVRARMIQLGHIQAKGALNYADKKLIQPFAFDSDSLREEQHTYVIDQETVSSLCRESDFFCAIMQSKKYIYADGHVVRNDPRFVHMVCERLMLTDWASAHVDDCCIRFVRVYVQQDVGKYVFGRMYYDADYVRQTQFYLDDLLNSADIDEIDAKNKYCACFPMVFREAVDQLRKQNHMSLERLAAFFNMDQRILRRYLDEPSRYRNEDFLTMLALIFSLPDWLSRMLFKRAHFQFDDEDRRHQALEHILRVQSADGIDRANEFLLKNHLPPLSV